MGKLILTFLMGISIMGCGYTQSALEYAGEGTKRVNAGYTAKTEMTKALANYLLEANKNCGVKVEMINNLPVTTVKECVRASEIMASVDRVEIVKPQRVADMLESAGSFARSITNLAVPFAGVYYGYKSNKVAQKANVEITKSNNAMSTSMWENYTKNYQNTQSTSTSTNTQSTETTTQTVPALTVETNTTKIGGN